MLQDLPRSDQRAKGELYVRGLLTDGARKSMQPMAARLGVDHQRLQQFITSSTWEYEQVRANVARWAVGAIGPDAYVIDDTGFPKDGTASPCVARQYSGTLGKTANCQIAVSVQVVSDAASVAANWRLFCPTSWDDTTTSSRPRPYASAGRGPASLTRCATGRSGAWRWTWSIRCSTSGSCLAGRSWPTPVTATPPCSGWA